jgi:hypothetical protein
MNLQELQRAVNDLWSRQINNPCHQSADANHALVHLTKALGKVASALNDAEHERRVVRADEVAKYLADLVICAARFAGDDVDLEAACAARLAEKFPARSGTLHDPRCRCGQFHDEPIPGSGERVPLECPVHPGH